MDWRGTKAYTEFQFLNGAIESNADTEENPLGTYFNSLMVRLREEAGLNAGLLYGNFNSLMVRLRVAPA